MKSVVYITKNKIWLNDHVFEWDGVRLDSIFGQIKKQVGSSEVRVVLGKEVSFVSAVRNYFGATTRDEVLKMVKRWMPFEIDTESFDWREITLGHDESWIQAVALEKEFLISLSAAVRNHGIKLGAVTSIGVVLAEKFKSRETPVVVRWSDKENLNVLAIKGMADLVFSEENTEELMAYAVSRWGLAVNPEIITLNKNNFDLVETVYAEKVKGEDKKVLSIPMLSGLVVENIVDDGEPLPLKVDEEVKPAKSVFGRVMVISFLITLVVGLIAFKFVVGEKQEVKNNESVDEVFVEPEPTEVVELQPEVIDLSNFSVQVLNGGGVVGEAARVRRKLLEMGYTKIEIGNTNATSEGVIRAKRSIDKSVIDRTYINLSAYSLEGSGILEEDGDFDLVIVISK